MKRRDFLRYNALYTVGALAGGSFIAELMANESVLEAAQSLSSAEKMIRVGCPAHNCGGRCLLRVFVKEGVIVKIETDDRSGDSIEDPHLYHNSYCGNNLRSVISGFNFTT